MGEGWVDRFFRELFVRRVGAVAEVARLGGDANFRQEYPTVGRRDAAGFGDEESTAGVCGGATGVAGGVPAVGRAGRSDDAADGVRF